MVRKICSAETADVFPGIVARNKAVLEYEEFIHFTFYPQVIHPYSRFRVYWEIIFLVFIPLKMLISSCLWVFLRRGFFAYTFYFTSLQAIELVDVILRFFTGYVEPKTGIVVLDPKKIFMNYIFKFFIFDIIPCIPVNVILYHNPYYARSMDFTFYFLFVIDNLFVLRAVTFFVYLSHTSNLFLWYPFLMGLISSVILVFMFYLLFMNAMLSLFFSYLDEISLETIYNSSLKSRMEIFREYNKRLIEYLARSSNIRQEDFKWRFPFLLIIFFCSIFILVYLTKFFLLKMNKEEKFLDLESRILCFGRKRHLSDLLTLKILLYFFILLENKYCKEEEIFLYIPNTFKSEIFFHLCLPLLKNFYAFENLPTYVLRRLAECMTYQLYLPNEIVMARAEGTLSMYFILRGTVALYSVQHAELYHFEAGSSINGKNFVLGDLNNNQYAISIEVTEVYRLNYVDYMEIMAAYPKLLKNIQRKFHQNKSELSTFLGYSSPWE